MTALSRLPGGSAVRRRTRTWLHAHPTVRRVVRDLRKRLGLHPRRATPPVRGHTVHVALPEHADGGTPDPLQMDVPTGMFVPRRLREVGLAGYEPESLAAFCAASEMAGPGAAVDVGANVGVYAWVAATSCRRHALAIEPTPDVAEVARRTVEDAGLPVDVLPIALGRRREVATLYLSDRTDTSNSLAAGFRSSSRTVDVRVETMDHLLAPGPVPAVVKVDTETTEPDVLAGAADVLRRHRPWLLVEVLHGRVEEALDEVMRPLGYTWYHVTDAPPWPVRDHFQGDPTYENLMWLLAPEPLGDDYWDAWRRWRDRIARCGPTA